MKTLMSVTAVFLFELAQAAPASVTPQYFQFKGASKLLVTSSGDEIISFASKENSCIASRTSLDTLKVSDRDVRKEFCYGDEPTTSKDSEFYSFDTGHPNQFTAYLFTSTFKQVGEFTLETEKFATGGSSFSNYCEEEALKFI